MNDKIGTHHVKRAAYVYVRQSTAHQVRYHQESRQRQYALAGRARELGFAKTLIIDEDQGKSGSGLQDRPGFGQLLAAVCRGEVGAVFALEASRLARNNRDWSDFPHPAGRCKFVLLSKWLRWLVREFVRQHLRRCGQVQTL